MLITIVNATHVYLMLFLGNVYKLSLLNNTYIPIKNVKRQALTPKKHPTYIINKKNFLLRDKKYNK